MASSTLLIVVVGLALLGYYLGRQRAVAAAVIAGPRNVHSLPGYHGGYVALWCVLPALALLVMWQVFEPTWLRSNVLDSLPASMQALPDDQLGLVYNDIRNLVEGNFVTAAPSPEIVSGRGALHVAARHESRLATAAVIVLGVLVARLGISARASRISALATASSA